MYRVTTPTHTFVLPIQTSTCTEILLTYKQGGTMLEKHYENGALPAGMTLYRNQVIQQLTQDETKLFKDGFAQVQIRVLTTEGKSFASQIFNIHINEVLDETVLS